MYDLKIVGGTVVDGTGAPGFVADVGVLGGKIVAVGQLTEGATREIDATGSLVIPGFVDLHTHYDGQATWDPDLAPSSMHGVTTAVMGSCGVGFAPVQPSDHDRLIALMEGVEDIPGTALHEGIDWRWTDFASYMDALDAMPHAFDLCCQVPHDALRVYVMGDRGFDREQATDEDIAAMRDELARALDAGAVGFSTGRTDNHRTNEGDFTPAADATARELSGIAAAFHGRDRGVVQAVSDFDMGIGADRFDSEWAMLEAMAESAGRPLSVSLLQRDQSPGQYRRILRAAEAANAKGMSVRVQVAPRAIGILLGLDATFHPFMGFPSFKEVSHLPLPELVEALRDPARRARILSEKGEPVAGDGSAIPPIADELLNKLALISMRMFRLGDPPDYCPPMEASLFAASQREGRPVLEVLYDALLEDEGRSLLYFPLYNYTAGNLDPVRDMLAHPLALPGLSDGGAHVGTVCDASFPTFLLSYWGRDRGADKLPIEHLVKLQTHDTARFLGLTDRGTIAVGQRADLNVIDFDKLRLRAPRMVHDLPAGGRRFLQDAEGLRYTFVAGEAIAEDGKLTGARPGRVVRL